MGPLATALLTLGFIPTLGTTETGPYGQTNTVKSGAPNRFDCNNGVVVVYDEKGVPWIVSMTNVTIPKMRELAREHRLHDGAYVPHSNDGGRFVCGNVPSLSAPS